MDSVACPLCCEDRFSNQDLLKYHLLSLTTNIQCPFCGKQCDDINSLVVHLDKMCVDKEEDDNDEEEVVGENANEKTANDDEMIVVYPDDDDEPDIDEDGIDIFDSNLIKEEEETYLNNQPLADAADPEPGVKKFIEEFTVDDASKMTAQGSETGSQIVLPNLYHCSDCKINFPSIQDHLNNCHKGQEVLFQVNENHENLHNTLKNMAEIIDKQTPQPGSWINWGNGFFYTNHHDLVMEHFENVIKSEKTSTLKLESENIMFQEINEENENKVQNNGQQIDNNTLNTNMYLDHCITDAYGDRYFDVPIYLLYRMAEEVNDYFQVEARKLSYKKRIRLVRIKSVTDNFSIEQILFQNKPNNCNFIPALEKVTECDEYAQLGNMDNCLLLNWKCVLCNAKSDHWTKLNKHNCKEDESTGSKSKKNTENKNPALRNNSRSVPTTRPQHICPHCNGEFDSEGYLRTHLMVHVNDSNKCPFCEQPVAPEMMETHLIAHQNPKFSNLKFLCNVCNKCYDSEFRLRCHQRAHEMRRKPREILVCAVCNAQFNDKNSLKHHAITHIEPPERLRRLHECRFCGKTFVKPIEKVNHERVHTGEKPFACPVCGRCFRLKDLVQKHMRVHTKERPYKCRFDGCEKTFSASSSRVNHEQGHSGIKQFKCFYCPRYFKNWVSRSNHVQEHMVQHKCEICDRAFVSFCNYKKHLKMHTEGRLKFNCVICRQSFGRQLFLDNHLVKEHQMKGAKGHNVIAE